MINITNKNNCCGCYACYNSCPKGCITMMSDDEGFVYPKIDTQKCVDCGICVTVCPEISPLKFGDRQNVDAFAALNNTKEVRLGSSSGGIFTLLAAEFIKCGGVVFGAAISDDCKRVIHISVETEEELEKLRGSKYVQSHIESTYREAKEYLDIGRTVLFSGTPCQIAGLYKYCGKEYRNLFTCDFICHGVPSPLVWKRYVEFREKEKNSIVKKISFRNKKYGWQKFSIQLLFDYNIYYTNTLTKDLYLRGFLSNIYLRPSCYECSFKGLERPSDITLADFWGVDNVVSGMNDNKGTSLVILNSKRGKELFTSLEQYMKIKSVDLEKSIRYNSAALMSPACPAKRNAFFAEFGKLPFEKLIYKYCAPTMKEKVRKTLGRILRFIKKRRV